MVKGELGFPHGTGINLWNDVPQGTITLNRGYFAFWTWENWKTWNSKGFCVNKESWITKD